MKGLNMATQDMATSQELNSLASMMGATAKPAANENAMRLPQLVVNSQADDDDGNPLPRGHFTIKNGETPAYAQTVTVRVLSNHFQYMTYDPNEKRVTCKSVEIANWGQEAIDTKGTTRCGKPTSAQLREMAPEDQERHKNTTCFRKIRVLVTGTAKTATGDVVEWKNVPAIIMAKGTNFNPFNDQVVKMLPNGRNAWDFNIELKAERQKNGSVVWFVINFYPDFKNPLAMDEEVVGHIKNFADSINAENARIKKQYEAALSSQTLDQSAIDAINNSLDDDLNDDLDDVA